MATPTLPTVLVIGANRGIGFALANGYAARGGGVIATARSPGAASALTDLARGNDRVRVLGLDVTDEAAWARLAAEVASEAIDLVIYNAGRMGTRGGLGETSIDAGEWASMMATNVTGAFLATRAMLPNLARARTGKAVGKLALISSMMGSSSSAGGDSYTYRVSKAALANLGANLSVELRSRGIAVGIYHPGWVKTDMGGDMAPVTPAASAAGLMRRIDKLSLATTGVFEDYLGQPLAF